MVVFWIYCIPDSKVQRANMGPTWVLSVPDGPHVGPMNLAIRDAFLIHYMATGVHQLFQHRQLSKYELLLVAGVKTSMRIWVMLSFVYISIYLCICDGPTTFTIKRQHLCKIKMSVYTILRPRIIHTSQQIFTQFLCILLWFDIVLVGILSV